MNRKYLCILVLLLSSQIARPMQFANHDGFVSLGLVALSKPILSYGLDIEKKKNQAFLDEGNICDFTVPCTLGTMSLGLGAHMLSLGLYNSSKNLFNVTFNEKTRKLLVAAPYLTVALSSLHSAAYFGKTFFTGKYDERKTWLSALYLTLNASIGITCLQSCAKLFPFKR